MNRYPITLVLQRRQNILKIFDPIASRIRRIIRLDVVRTRRAGNHIDACEPGLALNCGAAFQKTSRVIGGENW